MGLGRSSYDQLLNLDSDDRWYFNADEAAALLKSFDDQIARITKSDVDKAIIKPKPTKKSKPAKKASTNGKETVSSRIRSLINEGHSNSEIWEIVQPEYDLDDKKRSYPAWYRSQMKRAAE